jgi:adenosylmethionine-8-amino-7-oxononanoate aminotransferase
MERRITLSPPFTIAPLELERLVEAIADSIDELA